MLQHDMYTMTSFMKKILIFVWVYKCLGKKFVRNIFHGYLYGETWGWGGEEGESKREV